MFSNSPPNSWLSGVISRESLNMSFVTCMWWQRVDFCQKGKKRPKMCEVQPVFFPRVAHRGMESASDTSSVLETHDVITCARLNLAPSVVCAGQLSHISSSWGNFSCRPFSCSSPFFNQSTSSLCTASSMLRWVFWRTTHHRGFITLCTDKYWQTQTQYHKGECLMCHHLCAMLMNMNERCKHFVEPVELKKSRKFRGLNCFL